MNKRVRKAVSKRAPLRKVRAFRGRKVLGDVFHADALRLLGKLDNSAASIVFLDPPFNLGKEYSAQSKLDRRPVTEYERWLTQILDESIRVLEDGGALFLYHMPEWSVRFGAYLQQKLAFRHWIAVSMKNGFARGKHLYPAHYGLLYFTKGEPRHFKRPKLDPATCRHCGGLIKDYGGYLRIIQDKGLNLSDIWEDVSPVRHASTKTRSANELPGRMLERVVALAGRRGSLLVDPFCGSGTAGVAAANFGMRFMLGDVVKSNAELTVRRISASLK